MPRIHILLLALGAFSSLGWSTLRAEDVGTDEVRLRQTLRDTMLQLRQAQSDLANLQATQAAQADEEKTLKDQVALMTKHSADDKAESARSAETLKAKVAEQASLIAHLEDQLGQWKVAAERMNQSAKTLEAQRAKALAVASQLERRTEDLKSKNQELYRLGSEILDRYEKFSLGEQFLAREPFIGRTRVDLENQIQDYDDQLLAQKSTP